MVVSLSFAVGESEENESDEGNIRTFDVNEEDSEGNTSLFLVFRSGNLEISEILMVGGADVRATNYRDHTPLLVGVGVGKLDVDEILVRKGVDV
jgi:ankyrin repeat protein